MNKPPSLVYHNNFLIKLRLGNISTGVAINYFLVLCLFQELFHLTSPIGRDVRNSAILGFATLVHKTCVHKCSPDTVDRYAKLYLDQFTGTPF